MEPATSAAPEAPTTAPLTPAEVTVRKVARRHLKQKAWDAKIGRATLRRLILKAGVPMLRTRKGKAVWVAPRIEQGCHEHARELLDLLVQALSRKAAVLAEHRRGKTVYTRDVCYAARVLLNRNVF